MTVLEQFTQRRLADTHAIVELSNHTLPFNRSLFVQLIFRQRLAKLLHRLFPQRFLPPLFEALHESSIPYADILREYQSWCNKVAIADLNPQEDQIQLFGFAEQYSLDFLPNGAGNTDAKLIYDSGLDSGTELIAVLENVAPDLSINNFAVTFV